MTDLYGDEHEYNGQPVRCTKEAGHSGLHEAGPVPDEDAKQGLTVPTWSDDRKTGEEQ